MGDGPRFKYRGGPGGEPSVLLGEVKVPLWDADKQWAAVLSAFGGEPQELLRLVPFGPRLGLRYVAYQLDPVMRSAVSPHAQPPLTEQRISEHGDLSYEPVDTIPYTGDRAERDIGLEELNNSQYSLTNSMIRARSVLYVSNSIPAQILAYRAWWCNRGYPFDLFKIDWKNWLLAARSIEDVNISAANEMKRRGLALRLYVWQSLTVDT